METQQRIGIIIEYKIAWSRCQNDVYNILEVDGKSRRIGGLGCIAARKIVWNAETTMQQIIHHQQQQLDMSYR